jgi:hypothetical protein
MLDLQDEVGRLSVIDTITRMKCEINLPESWGEFLCQSGLTGSGESDRRQFSRWRNPTLAGLLHCETFPVIPRDQQWHPIYIKDLSFSGAVFINSEQLYPLEQMRLLFVDDVSSRLLRKDCFRTIEVVRCKRVQANCYEVAARFVV